ncbi:MAG TPA: hypothetical protein VEI83_16115 [Acidimicrobiales bacterium]|nr:hypothetical protein [Acidimicrobiales bacterium]
MHKRFSLKKRIVVAGAGVGLLAGAGAAYAYFTSTGTGSGDVTVGTATDWAVTVAAPTGGPLMPGSGSETVGYTVTNNGTSAQMLAAVKTTLDTDTNGNVMNANGHAVNGCLASWFTVTDAHPTPNQSVAADGGTYQSSATVTLNEQSPAVDQNACQGASPTLTVSAS